MTTLSQRTDCPLDIEGGVNYDSRLFEKWNQELKIELHFLLGNTNNTKCTFINWTIVVLSDSTWITLVADLAVLFRAERMGCQYVQTAAIWKLSWEQSPVGACYHAQSPELGMAVHDCNPGPLGGRRFGGSRSPSATKGVHGWSGLFEMCLKRRKEEERKGRKKKATVCWT